MRALAAAVLLLASAPAPASAQTAPEVRASGTVATGTDRFSLALLVDGDAAAVRVQRARDGAEQVFGLSDADSALLILADARLSFLWPALTDWAGPSLDRLRARLLAATRARWAAGQAAVPRTLTESSVRPRTRALLQHSRTLWSLGYRDEANGLLREAIAANPRATDWQRAEYSMVAIRLANQLFNGGDPAAADGVYVAMEAALSGSSYVINATINRAFLAVEQGRYDQGLALIDAGFAAFEGRDGQRRTGQGNAVPGALREFAWIKACAMHGLGRPAEATAAMGPALAVEEPHDDQFILVPNARIRLRSFMCTRDVEGAVGEMLGAIAAAALSPVELLSLQPGFVRADWDAATLAAVRADPRIRAALVGRMCVLPPELVPALRHWAPAGEPTPPRRADAASF